MPEKIASMVRTVFRFCGLRIESVPPFEQYEWLKEMNIHTILDIGANTGQFALQFHRLLPEARIYSFEPLEDCYNELLKKMRHSKKCHAFNFALGDKNAEVPIYRNEYTPSSSLLTMEDLHRRAFPFTKHTTIQTIPIKRLDDILDELNIVENILIKIDVQGTEDKVILGGEKLISKASVLIVEVSFRRLYENQPLFDDVYEMLKERGFVYRGTEQSLRDPSNGSILQCDAVFFNAKL